MSKVEGSCSDPVLGHEYALMGFHGKHTAVKLEPRLGCNLSSLGQNWKSDLISITTARKQHYLMSMGATGLRVHIQLMHHATTCPYTKS